jgi:hypothetical protein
MASVLSGLLVACGGGGAGGGETVCDRQAAGGCLGPFFKTADQCNAFSDGIVARLDSVCQVTAEASEDCQLSQPDICDMRALRQACGAQIDAANACLNQLKN